MGLFFIFILNFSSASTYYLEFNQIEKSIVVKESLNFTQNMSYEESDSLEFFKKNIYFLKKITFQEDFDSVIVILNLEKGVIIEDKKVFPENYQIETDGENISITWEIQKVKKGGIFSVFVVLEDTKKDNTFYFFLIGIFFLLSFLVFLFFKLNDAKNKRKSYPSIKPKIKEKFSSIKYNYLLDTEKKIIEELKKADRNELWQKQLQSFTGFSKAKISRLIRNLESRGLVYRIPFGNTNKIRLK